MEGWSGQGRAGLVRAGLGWSGQGRAWPGRAGPGWAGQGWALTICQYRITLGLNTEYGSFISLIYSSCLCLYVDEEVGPTQYHIQHLNTPDSCAQVKQLSEETSRLKTRALEAAQRAEKEEAARRAAESQVSQMKLMVDSSKGAEQALAAQMEQLQQQLAEASSVIEGVRVERNKLQVGCGGAVLSVLCAQAVLLHHTSKACITPPLGKCISTPAWTKPGCLEALVLLS